jgi:hypothetical protein
MALQAVAVTTEVAPIRPPLAPTRTADVLVHRPRSRAEQIAEVRDQRRRWTVVGVLLLAAPFVGCLSILEVVR